MSQILCVRHNFCPIALSKGVGVVKREREFRDGRKWTVGAVYVVGNKEIGIKQQEERCLKF